MERLKVGCFLFLSLFLLQPGFAANSIIVFPQPYFTNYNVFVMTQVITNSDGVADGGDELLTVTNENENVSVQLVAQNPLITIYSFQVEVPANVLTKPYTLTWTNYIYGTNYTSPLNVGAAAFPLLPTSQSVFVSNTVSFVAQAVHTTGYQWQKDGTNLLEDSHFVGVTNATLTISNAQFTDVGNYTVIANHPTNPASADAALNVLKPMQLGIALLPGFGSRLLVANQDGSPFETNRIPNL